ncbi:unnamed protein product [Paramecium octaurelia]|uniref:Transmembrane protein n=1 Tax=Paramecium octaurelia TaxID=43137 RepID=A0A8S1YMK9_PAROT|nr:unnamed protein product [Paramecium octaurelia]
MKYLSYEYCQLGIAMISNFSLTLQHKNSIRLQDFIEVNCYPEIDKQCQVIYVKLISLQKYTSSSKQQLRIFIITLSRFVFFKNSRNAKILIEIDIPNKIKIFNGFIFIIMDIISLYLDIAYQMIKKNVYKIRFNSPKGICMFQ